MGKHWQSKIGKSEELVKRADHIKINKFDKNSRLRLNVHHITYQNFNATTTEWLQKFCNQSLSINSNKTTCLHETSTLNGTRIN